MFFANYPAEKLFSPTLAWE